MLGDKKWQVAGAAAGVAAATALASGLLMAADAEDAVNKLSAQLGLTKEESAKAGAVAGKLYSQNYGDSMEDVTDATAAVMSSIKGMRTASESDVTAITGKMMNLAKVMDIDVTRAAQVAGQMVTTGLAKDATEAADLLTVALQKVPASVREDILDATDEYGPFFQQLGIGGETAMELLVKSSEKGMYGIDKTGDALKEFTIRSTDMSKASGIAYDALGLSQEQMTKDILAGGSKASVAFAKITSALGDMKDPAAQSQAALALFGTPLEDLGTNGIPKFIDSLNNMGSEGFGKVEGAADKMGETLNAGAGAQLKTFTRAAQQTLSDLGATILPILTPILQGLSKWAPIIGPLVIVLGAFAAVMWVVNAAMMASPITWIVLGIVALIAAIVLLVMNWDTVVAFLKKTWDGFVGWFTGVMDGFFGWWNDLWAGFFSFVKGVWDNIVLIITTVWGTIFAVIRTYINMVLTVITTVWNAIVTAVTWYLGMVLTVITTVWSTIVAVFTTVWGTIGGVVSTGINLVLSVITAVFGAVSNFISTVWGRIKLVFVVTLALIISTVRTAWQTISGVFTSFMVKIAGFLTGAWNGVRGTVTSVWNSIVGWIAGIPNRFVSSLSGISSLSIKMGLWILGVKNAAVNKFNELVAWVKGVPSSIVSALGNMGQLLVNAGTQIIQGFLNGLKSGFESVKSFVGGIGTWIKNHKGPKAYDLALLVPAGGWIMNGLDRGLQAYMPKLGSTLGDISWMIQNGIDPEIGVNGQGYAFSGSPTTAPTPVGAQSGPVYHQTFHVEKADGVDPETLARGMAEQILWKART